MMKKSIEDLLIFGTIITALLVIPIAIHARKVADTTDVYYMSEAIYYEARGEPFSGMIAVGQVIKNRTLSTHYPDTIEAVVKQHRQFSYRNAGDPPAPRNKPVYQLCRIISYGVLSNRYPDFAKGAEFYVNKKTATDDAWISELVVTNTIGRHTFYRYRKEGDK